MYSPKQSKLFVYSIAIAMTAAAGACTFSPSKAGSEMTPGTTGAGGGAAGAFYIPGTGGNGPGSGNGGTGIVGGGGPMGIPDDFTRGNVGAWKVGNPINPNGPATDVDSPVGGCYQLRGVVRDFKGADEAGGHPDFETYQGNAQTAGLVAAALGADRKPTYASMCEKAAPAPAPTCPYGPQTTSAADFMPWYHTTDPTNKAFEIFFILEPLNGKTTFQSKAFFPLDADKVPMSFGNNGRAHNFGFTTELHTKFIYRGGETFTFEGDDDLWVFVNKKLALDLGGLHPEVNGTIDMDAMAGQLGLAKGGTYDLELFHAERHTNASNFRVDTNFVFVDCGTIIP